MAEQETNGKKRVQFDFSESSLTKLDEMVENMGASSRAEVIRKALTLLTEAEAAKSRGARFMIEESNGDRVILRLI